jgi:hypothetical protein
MFRRRCFVLLRHGSEKKRLTIGKIQSIVTIADYVKSHCAHLFSPDQSAVNAFSRKQSTSTGPPFMPAIGRLQLSAMSLVSLSGGSGRRRESGGAGQVDHYHVCVILIPSLFYA